MGSLISDGPSRRRNSPVRHQHTYAVNDDCLGDGVRRLDRDSTRWNLDAEETQKRRELFWEIYVYDSWQVGISLRTRRFLLSDFTFAQSLTYGRPPSLAMAHVDCKMAHETRKDANGSIEMSCKCFGLSVYWPSRARTGR